MPNPSLIFPLDDVSLIEKQRDIFKNQFIKIQENYEKKIQELSLLTELSNALRTTNFQDKDAFFFHQLKIVNKYRKLDGISLMIFSEDQQRLNAIAMIKADDRPSMPKFLMNEEGPPELAFMQGKYVKIDILQNDVFFMGNYPDETGSLLCIPLLHNKKAFGILNLYSLNVNSFHQSDVRFFSLIADQLATADIIFRFYHQMLKEEKKRLQLSRFFSKNIVQKILSSDDNLKLGGERKKVTVLFADLRGFTTISETLDQKKVVELLNAYFTRMTPIIFKNNGTLDKLMGDGILALFGAPISYADDAVQAVKTAIELIMALREFNVQMRKYGMPHLDLSIGINTGEVVAGYIGSEEHLNYTVIGDPVNTAQRIQSVAGYNEILISEAVFDALDTGIHQISGLKSIEPISPLKLKGKQKILNAYRVVIS